MSLINKIVVFLRKPLHDKANALHIVLSRVKGILYYRRVFGSFGQGSVLLKPLLLGNPRFVHLGKNTFIRQGARIEIILGNTPRIPELRIGDNVNIEQNVHIVCHSRLIIGSNVSITGHCAIVDVTHPYLNVDDPTKIGDRILDDNSSVEIGDGSFLGFNVLIMPNVHVGKYCVIGAHSVVLKDVPDYSVVAGNPAKVIRQYDIETREWHTPL